MIGWLALLVAALLGAPLFVLIGGAAAWGFHLAEYDLTIVAVEFQRLGQMPGLEAIPLFALAGCLRCASGTPKRLVALSESWLGWMPGGLAIVAVVTCALFTAFTGASGVTIVALGGLLYPALIAAGYERRFVLGLLVSGGSLGLLFAPSLPLILYGFVAGQMGTTPPTTVEDLFLAGIAPGLLMVLAMAAMAVQAGRRLPAGPAFNLRHALASLRHAAWELPLPVLVLGGIYAGVLAASEAAAITALYVLLLTVLIRREITLRDLLPLCADAARLIGAILLILGMALALSNWLVDQEMPTRLFDWISTHVDSRWVFLLLLNVFLLGVGMLLDIFSAVVILVPLLLPVAQGFGIDPVHLGIILLANLQLGYFTPPVGMNLFIASYRFHTPVTELVRASLPFFFLLLACVAAITWVPLLSLVFVR
jgi:C4-dicarboxylate transporter, DctM subunit